MAAETKSKNDDKSFIQNILSYFREVYTESHKVSWPTNEDVIRLLRVVLIVTAITSLGLGALSIGMTFFLDQFGFDYPLILVALFVIIAIVTWWSFRDTESKGY